MYNCEQYWDLISTGVDGALTELEQVRLQAHLEQCPQCRALYEQMQSMCDGLDKLEAAPAGFADGVMAQAAVAPQQMPFTALDETRDIHAEDSTLLREWWRPLRRVVGLVACCLIVVGVWRVSNWTLGGKSAANGASAPGAQESMTHDAAQDVIYSSAESQTADSASGEDQKGSEGSMEEPDYETLEVEGTVYVCSGAVANLVPEEYAWAGTLPDGRDYYAGADGIYVAEEDGFTFWYSE